MESNTFYKKQANILQIFTIVNDWIHILDTLEWTQWPAFINLAHSVSDHIFMHSWNILFINSICALFPPTYSDPGSFWPFPFLLFKKRSSQKANILNEKPRQKNRSALATHFPYAFALCFTWACSRVHRDQEKNLWICPVLQFLRAIKCYSTCNIPFCKTISYVQTSVSFWFPHSQDNSFFVQASMFMVCYLISGLSFNIEQSQKRIILLFKMQRFTSAYIFKIHKHTLKSLRKYTLINAVICMMIFNTSCILVPLSPLWNSFFFL